MVTFSSSEWFLRYLASFNYYFLKKNEKKNQRAKKRRAKRQDLIFAEENVG